MVGTRYVIAGGSHAQPVLSSESLDGEGLSTKAFLMAMRAVEVSGQYGQRIASKSVLGACAKELDGLGKELLAKSRKCGLLAKYQARDASLYVTIDGLAAGVVSKFNQCAKMIDGLVLVRQATVYEGNTEYEKLADIMRRMHKELERYAGLNMQELTRLAADYIEEQRNRAAEYLRRQKLKEAGYLEWVYSLRQDRGCTLKQIGKRIGLSGQGAAKTIERRHQLVKSHLKALRCEYYLEALQSISGQ